jgi:hypothetical protein
MEVSGQLHASAALPPGKDPRYPLDRRLGGPQNRSERGGEEKNSQPPARIEPDNPDLPIRIPVLYRLILTIFISKTFNSCPSFKVREQVSHPYKGKIKILML